MDSGRDSQRIRSTEWSHERRVDDFVRFICATDGPFTDLIDRIVGGTIKAAHAIEKLVERQMWVHFRSIQQMLHVACTNLLGEARETEQLK
jgi:hypothetical protein